MTALTRASSLVRGQTARSPSKPGQCSGGEPKRFRHERRARAHQARRQGGGSKCQTDADLEAVRRRWGTSSEPCSRCQEEHARLPRGASPQARGTRPGQVSRRVLEPKPTCRKIKINRTCFEPRRNMRAITQLSIVTRKKKKKKISAFP